MPRDPTLSSWRVKDHRQTAGSLRLLTLGVHQVQGDSGASERGAIDVLEKEIGGFPPGAGLDMRMHSRSTLSQRVCGQALGRCSTTGPWPP